MTLLKTVSMINIETVFISTGIRNTKNDEVITCIKLIAIQFNNYKLKTISPQISLFN
jgi:hypothetical protein